MSIFWIILLAFILAAVIAVLGVVIVLMITDYDLPDGFTITMGLISVVLWITFIFAGIGINTEDHELWLANYEAQKYTIESSLESETLSGFERMELVNKAAELNGDLAYRKESIKLWHHVVYGDKTIYDGVEPINIK